jgi:hypothetical protein
MMFYESFTVAVILRFLRTLVWQNDTCVDFIVDGRSVHDTELMQAWLKKPPKRMRVRSHPAIVRNSRSACRATDGALAIAAHRSAESAGIRRALC